jgi:hypothetical protein
VPYQIVETATALTAAAMSSTGDHPAHMQAVLQASAPLIENLLGTTLNQEDRIDWFRYDPSRYVASKFREVKFLLKKGFVDPDETFAVYQSNDGYPVLQDFSNADLMVFNEDYLVDEEEGSFTILKVVSIGTGAVAVSYSSGFREASGVLVDVPDWLSAAATSGGIRWMLANQSKWNNKERVDLTPEVIALFRQHLNEHIRTKYGEHPFRSVVAS